MKFLTKKRRSMDNPKCDLTSAIERGVVPSEMVESQVRSNSKDTPSSSGRGSADHLADLMTLQQHSEQQNDKSITTRDKSQTLHSHGLNSKDKLSCGPQTNTRRTAVISEQTEKKKKRSILKKLFGSCFPFFFKKKKKRNTEQVVKPIQNKHISRVKYGPESQPPLMTNDELTLSFLYHSYSFDRERRKIQILRDKGFEPKKVNGILRYIKTEDSRHLSFKCLTPQKGRDDSLRAMVHKPIALMASGAKHIDQRDINWKQLGFKYESQIKELYKSEHMTPRYEEQKVRENLFYTSRSIEVNTIVKGVPQIENKSLSKEIHSVILSEEKSEVLKIGSNIIEVSAKVDLIDTQYKSDLNLSKVVVVNPLVESLTAIKGQNPESVLKNDSHCSDIGSVIHLKEIEDILNVDIEKVNESVPDMNARPSPEIKTGRPLKVVDKENSSKHLKNIIDSRLLISEQKEQIVMDSVAAENKITSSPSQPLVLKDKMADKVADNNSVAKESNNYICFDEFKENEDISEKVFQKLDKKAPKDMMKQMSTIISGMFQTLKTNDILIGQFLGIGTFGFVFEGLMKGQRIAIKFNIDSEKSLEFLREMNTLRQFRHQNVLSLIELEPKVNRLIVTECADSDLKVFMYCYYKSRHFIEFETCRQLSKQIICGVQYIHSKGFAHLDIKCENILIVKSSSGEVTAKVADLGCAKNCFDEGGQLIQKRLITGTSNFWPPEMLLKQKMNDMRKPDVWAIGFIVFELIGLGKTPLPSYHRKEDKDGFIAKERANFSEEKQNLIYSNLIRYRKIDDKRYKKTINEIINLIKRLLNPDCNQRESLKDILNDPWFTSTEKRPDFYYQRISIIKHKKVKANKNTQYKSDLNLSEVVVVNPLVESLTAIKGQNPESVLKNDSHCSDIESVITLKEIEDIHNVDIEKVNESVPDMNARPSPEIKTGRPLEVVDKENSSKHLKNIIDSRLLISEQKEQIVMDSVAAENKITSSPSQPLVVKDKMADKIVDKVADNNSAAKESNNYICFDEFKENEDISEKVFQKLDKKAPKDMMKQMSTIISGMFQTLKTNNILIGQFLGNGTFGFVFEGLMRGQRIALKFNIDSERVLEFWREMNTLRQFRHQNVLSLIELEPQVNNLIVTECADSQLRDFMNCYYKSRHFIEFETCRQLSKQIICGVQYIHSKGFAHLDIKSDNILIVKSSSGEVTAKVADLGCALNCFDEGGQLIRKRLITGTANFWPPEMLLKQKMNDIRKPDVWAIGFIVYELIGLGKRPLPGYRRNEDKDGSIAKERANFSEEKQNSIYNELTLYRKIDDKRYKNTINEIINLIKRLLNPDCDRRETLKDILNDPWFTSTEKRPDFYYQRIPIIKPKRVKTNKK